MFSFFGKRSKQDDASAAPPPAVASVTTPVADEPQPPQGATSGLNVDALLQPPAAAPAAAFGPTDPDRTDVLKPSIVEAISTVFDPEIPVNIYELGLIYEISADSESRVLVRMTLTSPACPSAQQLPSEVRYKVKALEGVSDCTVDIVWEPPWTKDMMSETAKLSLGMF
jgi:FeS assembly SUF system protein